MSDKASKPQREPSKSTLRRHRNDKSSQADKATQQQYLRPREEKALVEYVLRLSDRGHPLPVKFLRSLAPVIARRRGSPFQILTSDCRGTRSKTATAV